MNKAKFIETQIKKYSKLLNIKYEIDVKNDKKLEMNYCASVTIMRWCDTKKLFYSFKYSIDKFKNKTKFEIINIVLHELAHIVLDHETSNDSLIQKEYDAEAFAIKNIKKYLPQYYDKAVNYLKAYIKCPNKIYKLAFTKLYKELKNENIK